MFQFVLGFFKISPSPASVSLSVGKEKIRCRRRSVLNLPFGVIILLTEVLVSLRGEEEEKRVLL